MHLAEVNRYLLMARNGDKRGKDSAVLEAVTNRTPSQLGVYCALSAESAEAKKLVAGLV
jgi:hypothetical protein